jgi:3'(2'),5'-bisphosphate nucleotidase
MQDDDALAEIFAFLALKAGAAIMRVRASGARARIKSDSSPVCDADLLAEEIILEGLVRLAPRFPIVAEELCASGGTPEIDGGPFFLVDPLDGTREFLEGRDCFSVNIALIRDGAPAVGVVFAPARGEMFVAGSHAWAFAAEPEGGLPPRAEWREMHVRSMPERDAVAVASRSHLDTGTKRFLGRLTVRDIVPIGSSLKFCLLASGEADVYPRFGPTMEWDTAAGDAVLRAAGGRVFDARGGPFIYGKTNAGLRNSGFVAWGATP